MNSVLEPSEAVIKLAVTLPFATAVVTNAVVASCVVFVAAAAVGAVGDPVRAGEADRTTLPVPVVPSLRSAAAGCVRLGTPLVEIVLIHLCDAEAMLCTPPNVELEGFGKSAPTSERKVGVAALPVVGPAKTKLALSVDRLIASVPLPVIGEPLTENPVGTVRATLVTVPVVAGAHDGFALAPPVCNTCPADPGAKVTHPDALR